MDKLNPVPHKTVAELISELQGMPQNAWVYFSGLTYYRLKQRGDDLVQVEFAEVVYRDAEGFLVAHDLKQ